VPRDEDSDTVLPSLNLDLLGQRSKTPAPTSKENRGAKTGDVIGERYIVDGQIGRGGMGRVLRVRHQVLDKAFALKLTKARYATDTQERLRFYREARLASSLDHDNICSVVDFGDDPRFGLFMVMDLLEGQALKDKLKDDGRLSPKAAADVMMQIAEALRYVHSQGIVHGDIKPDNILLVRTVDRHRSVKLLDFGLAHVGKGDEATQLRGTPEYLAPERVAKKQATVASDIFALGVLFYELLVGTPPFRGTAKEVLKQHQDAAIQAPSSLIADELDERADLIIQRATAKDPADRHPNVSAFIYELNAFCAMHGIAIKRRNSDSPSLVRKAASQAAQAGSEIFELAAIPLAAVSRDGTIRTANRSFRRFIGQSKPSADLRLPQTALLKVYPDLVKDLATIAATGTTIKRSFSMRAGDNKKIAVAIILSAPPADECTQSGDIHIAIHPLGRP
jgi:serine/threonine protein kinase